MLGDATGTSVRSWGEAAEAAHVIDGRALHGVALLFEHSAPVHHCRLQLPSVLPMVNVSNSANG